jgi:sodium-coupled neutral amino acid transporter 11
MYNGKLAGRSTYQDLLEFAFGRPGLIAISVFQFAFAFGGKTEKKSLNSG